MCKCVLLLDGQLERITLIMRSESLEVPIVTLSVLHYIKKMFQKVKHWGQTMGAWWRQNPLLTPLGFPLVERGQQTDTQGHGCGSNPVLF